jgi:methylenetetrahydrofolate dehydrogenase (NADP+) / methenyltetrahydrofolate cyclohydrolase
MLNKTMPFERSFATTNHSPMILLDGVQTSQFFRNKIREASAILPRRPHLAAVLVGDNPASESYVGAKIKACQEVGFQSTLVRKPDTITQEELVAIVHRLNADNEIDGYIVQLPLPRHISEQAVLLAIDPAKDVDGFHPENFGRMALGLDAFLPATPFGITLLLQHFAIPTEGKHCVVLGRSQIVGLPVSLLLQRNTTPGNCTVTIAHSRTQHLPELIKTADILIAAIGKPLFVQGEWIKNGAVIIDVGINRVEDVSRKSGFRMVGDVDFDAVAPIASAITPVPGGVGPMTIVGLLSNTLKASSNNPYRSAYTNPKLQLL